MTDADTGGEAPQIRVLTGETSTVGLTLATSMLPLFLLAVPDSGGTDGYHRIHTGIASAETSLSVTLLDSDTSAIRDFGHFHAVAQDDYQIDIAPLRLSAEGARTLADLLMNPPTANAKLRALFHGDSEDQRG